MTGDNHSSLQISENEGKTLERTVGRKLAPERYVQSILIVKGD